MIIIGLMRNLCFILALNSIEVYKLKFLRELKTGVHKNLICDYHVPPSFVFWLHLVFCYESIKGSLFGSFNDLESFIIWKDLFFGKL